MAITLQQLMALKQKMAKGNPMSVPAVTKQPVARGVAPGAYGYADGGMASDDDSNSDLASYMPTDAEAEASGYPPGPQRKQYIAQKRKNAADAANISKDSGQPMPPGYSDGTKDGPVGKTKVASPILGAQATNSYDKSLKVKPVTTQYDMPSDIDPQDAADLGVEQTQANPPAPGTGGQSDEMKEVLASVPHYAEGTEDGPVSEDDAPATEEAPVAVVQTPAVAEAPGAVEVPAETVPPAATKEGLESLRAKLNALSDEATRQGQMAVNDATGKGVMEGHLPAAGAPKTLVLPNGGMSGEKLAKYIDEHPGPKAEVGRNMNLADDSDEDEDEQEQQAPVSSRTIAKASVAPAANKDEDEEEAPAAPVAPVAAPTRQDPVQALLDKLGMGQKSNDRLAQLQDQQREMMRNTAVQQGVDRMLGGVAQRYGGKYAPDDAYVKQMNEMAAQPVQAEMQRRTAMKDAIDTGMKATDFADKQQTTDPSSPVSQAFRSMALSWNPQLKATPGFDNMDAEGIKQMLPGIDMQVKRDYMVADTKLRTQQQAETNAERRDYQTSQKQAASEMRLGNTLTQMNSLRGANGQSQKNSQLADRIIDLSNSYNPNDPASVANARLILNENMGMLAQAANGGVAHEGQIDRIYPSNIADQIAKIKQYITSAPAGYDIQPYLDQAVKQAKIFKQIGQNYEKKNNAMMLYGAKNAVSPEVYEHYKNQLGLEDEDLNNAYYRTADTTIKAAKKTNTDVQSVKMRDPQGNLRLVAPADVKAALAAGGTMAQ